MPTVTVDYTPNTRQYQFHESGAQQVVYGGAKGGGKSCALVMEALAYGCEHPGAQIYLYRKTYDDLEANLIREAKDKWPKELYRYNESKHVATLYNGTQVYFRYISNYDDAAGYQGRSMDFVGVDELTQHEERSIQVLLSCLRSPKGYPARFRATCNPGDIGHAWVKKRYIEATDYGAKVAADPVTDKPIAFIPAQVFDNTVLMENDPDYVKRLEDLPEELRRAFLYGDWDVFMGQYFGEYRRDVHVIEPFTIPEHWLKIRALDEGYNDPFGCLWLAFDEKHNGYVYREFLQSQLLSEQQARLALERTQESIRYSVGDTSFWNTSKDTGEAPAEIFARAGLPMIQATKQRITGWMRVRDWLHVFDDTDPVSGKTFPNARLKIFSTCTNLIEALPSMVYDERNVEDMAPHLLDHLVDCLRYGLMSRPAPAKTPSAPIPVDPEQRWLQEMNKKHFAKVKARQRRGRL